MTKTDTFGEIATLMLGCSYYLGPDLGLQKESTSLISVQQLASPPTCSCHLVRGLLFFLLPIGPQMSNPSYVSYARNIINICKQLLIISAAIHANHVFFHWAVNTFLYFYMEYGQLVWALKQSVIKFV